MDRRAIVAHIGKLWTALSELEKAPYVAGALCDRQRLEEIKATWIDHPPKEPVNAFMYFGAEQRSNVLQANPGMKFGAAAQHLGALWRGASDAQKAPYIERARRDSIRYSNDVAQWKQQAKLFRKPAATRGRGRPPTKKAVQPKNPAPKKPASSYIYFMMEHRARVLKQHPKWTPGEIAKELGRQWREDLSAEDKAPYTQQVQDARLVYNAYVEQQQPPPLTTTATATAAAALLQLQSNPQQLLQHQPNSQQRQVQMVGHPEIVYMTPAAGQPGSTNDDPQAGKHVYRSDMFPS
jgi:hypothetical protein